MKKMFTYVCRGTKLLQDLSDFIKTNIASFTLSFQPSLLDENNQVFQSKKQKIVRIRESISIKGTTT